MEQIKGLTNAIDLATSDMQQGPSPQLYTQVEKWVATRADMPKHCIAHVSKRLMIKNDKVTFLTIDLLEYIMYVTELPFWTQLCTKEFLMKISQILQSKEKTSQVSQRILQFTKSAYELFKPHQDLLPTFFQFYEGLVKKGYDQKSGYVSPYRPAELKKYPTKEETKPKLTTTTSPPALPRKQSKNEPQKYSIVGMRERIVLTNEIIDECNPAEQVKNNNLLMEMVTGLKQIEKTLNNMINQGCDEKTMEQAIALNDDLLITFRRFKDLQKNRKPQPFLKTELASNYMVREENKPQKKGERSIFDQYDLNQPQIKPKKPEKKQEVNIFEFDDPKQPESKPTKQGSFNIFDLDEDSKPSQNLNTSSNSVPMNTLSSVQMNMGTMSVPMQNVANFNSGLLGLNLGPTQSPVQPKQSLSFNNPSPTKAGFNFGNINAPSNLQLGPSISMNSGSGLNYNSEFATEAVKMGNYTERDLTDLTELFSKKL